MQAQAHPIGANTNAASQQEGYRPPVLVMQDGLQAAAEIGPVVESQ